MSYYKTTDPVAMEKARAWLASFAAHRDAALALSAELGGSNSKFYNIRGRLAGIVFEPDADIPAHFRKLGDPRAWWPRRNTVEGRAISQRIRDLPQILDARDVNAAIGYNPGLYCTIGAGMVFVDHPHFVLTAEALFFSFPDQVNWYRAPAHVTEIVSSEFHTAAMKTMEASDACQN